MFFAVLWPILETKHLFLERFGGGLLRVLRGICCLRFTIHFPFCTLRPKSRQAAMPCCRHIDALTKKGVAPEVVAADVLISINLLKSHARLGQAGWKVAPNPLVRFLSAIGDPFSVDANKGGFPGILLLSFSSGGQPLANPLRDSREGCPNQRRSLHHERKAACPFAAHHRLWG